MDYGTGAIFGCPAHDQRDLEFARRYGLPVLRRAAAGADPDSFTIGDEAYVGDGRLFGRDSSTGSSRDREAARIEELEHAARAAARPPGACATGACPASATGVARSR